jgi:glycosyltransferase involved in cell wall biosynthesis
MTVETAKDAAFRVKAAVFCDKLADNMAGGDTPIDLPQNVKEIYTLYPGRPITNQEFIKEKNLNGLFLSKLTGGRHHYAFGYSKRDYPFYKYVPETDFQTLDEFTADAYREYIEKNAVDMDVLILPEVTYTHPFLAETFLENRKNGKIIVTADSTRGDIDKCFWFDNRDLIKNTFESLDLMTVPSPDLRDRINGNCEYKFAAFTLRHGFFNAPNEDISVTADDKENVILTVGNLDCDYKNVLSLLKAFAAAANRLRDWKLVLVGDFSDDNRAWVYETYSELADRIIITGDLDKPQLYKWYRIAKIFCMPTLCDCSPLVCAEAMAFGCYQVLSDSMDGAEDFVRNGEFGEIYRQEQYIIHPRRWKYVYSDDYRGEAERNLSNALIRAAKKLDRDFFKDFIPKSKEVQQSEFDYTINARKLALMLFA